MACYPLYHSELGLNLGLSVDGSQARSYLDWLTSSRGLESYNNLEAAARNSYAKYLEYLCNPSGSPGSASGGQGPTSTFPSPPRSSNPPNPTSSSGGSSEAPSFTSVGPTINISLGASGLGPMAGNAAGPNPGRPFGQESSRASESSEASSYEEHAEWMLRRIARARQAGANAKEKLADPGARMAPTPWMEALPPPKTNPLLSWR